MACRVAVLPGWVGRRGGVGAPSWGVWLLVGLAGLGEAQLCPQPELRLPPLPMWPRQPGRGRAAGTAACHSQSEAGVTRGSSPPTGPRPEGRWGWWPAAGGGQCPPPHHRPCPFCWRTMPAFLAQTVRVGVCGPHSDLCEPRWRQEWLAGHRPLPSPGGDFSGQWVQHEARVAHPGGSLQILAPSTSRGAQVPLSLP